MLVVDTSALAAVLFREPEREQFNEILVRNRCSISMGSLFEAEALMLRRKGPAGLSELRELLRVVPLEPIAVTSQDLEIARRGNEAFGIGRRAHPAVLNFGDLFAYALAKRMNLPLLFKGNDFAQTDITPALAA